MTGSLITASQSVGNFQTLQLNTQVGLWEIKMVSPNPYTLKVVGANASMMVTISGSDSAIVREVTLVESLGSGMVNGTIETQSERNVLIRFDKIPSARFAVLVKGQISNASTKASSVPFQRQSSTTIRSSNVTVTVTDTNGVLVPGTPRLLPFSVTTSGAGGNFIIQATNDQGFSSTFPSSLSLEAGGSAYGIVTITAPPDTTSGTSVTLTIGAEAPGGADTNYAVLTMETVTQPMSAAQPTVQLLLQLQLVIVGAVSSGDWASCCSPNVELLIGDQAGNVGICSYTVQNNFTTTTQASGTAATSNT
uniref:uncharacterized protein LOC109970471 n=1 Tax=Monopterus albus TaxID=43700 RepID=UPI0009B36CEF|nr:uncharacterized protein LOC109970471 [Monopterus albus]